MLLDKIGSWKDRSGDGYKEREREREKTTAMFGFDLMEDLPSRCRESMFLGWKED